jgi:hypothetical protein
MNEGSEENKNINNKIDGPYTIWQGWQFENQTFDQELAKMDAKEIRELLDEDVTRQPFERPVP